MRARVSGARTAAGVLGAAQLTLGIALTVWPVQVLRSLGATEDPVTRAGARVLGVRLVVQGVLVATVRRAQIHEASAMVDGAHATSMLALAAHSPRRYRAAMASGALATVTALASAAIAHDERAAPGTPGGLDRRLSTQHAGARCGNRATH